MYSIKKYTLAVSTLLLLHAQSYAMERVADRSGSEDLSFVLNFQGDVLKKLSAFTEVHIKEYEEKRDAKRKQCTEKIEQYRATIERKDATDEEKEIAQEELAFMQDRKQPCMEEYYASKIRSAAQDAADCMSMILANGLSALKQGNADGSGGAAPGNLQEWEYISNKNEYVFKIEDPNVTIESKQNAALNLYYLESRWAISRFNPRAQEEKKSWYQDLGDFPDSVSPEMIKEFYKSMRNHERVMNCGWLPREERGRSAYVFYFLRERRASNTDIAELVETAKRIK